MGDQRGLLMGASARAMLVHFRAVRETQKAEGIKHRRTVLQESRTIDAISEYFRHPIEEVPYNDDAKFEEVLVAAGLSRGTD